MNLAVLEAFLGLAVVANLGLLVLALVDLAQRPAQTWDAAGHSKLVWALIVIFLGFIGPLLYLVVARPTLNTAAAKGLR